MAPWPEPENQPKAPDKNDKREQTEVNTRSESEEAADNTICASSDQKVEDKDVSGLNDGQLRALLDEAFSYKCPKDREGKSELFKELLQEAEADETDSKVLGGSLGGKLPRAHYNLQRRRQSRHSGASRECGVGVSTTRGGSLQNLHALGMEGGRRSRRRDTLVSARQREGGSLPTNVNVDDHDLDIICPNYTSRATLEVKEPKKPESMERLETTAQGIPNGSEIITKEEEARVDNAFASSISVGPVESGAMLYPSTPVQHVSVLSIPPGQLSVGTDSNTRLAFSNSADSKAKPVDENGNALSCVRVDSNCLDRKKQRRVKTKNDRNTISLKIDEIEGFRGEADIDTLMEYIESPSLDSNKNKARSNQPNNPRTSVKVRAKEEEPRSTKKRREKFKRSNSLEEVSKTKLEDLTEHTSSEKIKSSLPIQKKPLTVEDTDVWQRSSWNKDEDHLLQEPKKMSSERISPELLQESEFLIVTKKQRKKKRRVVCSSRSTSKTTYYSRESGSGRLLYQYQNDQGTSQPRRKSASSVPPSDKSDSSDLDSVHSLPVSSSTRQRVMKNSVSGGSTPQASYADIARSAAGLPSDSCVINVVTYTDSDIRTSVIPILSLPSPAASKKDATTETCDTFLTTEDYPPLDNRNVDFCTDISKFPLSGTKDKSRKQPVIVRDNERPAVILMNDRAEAQISEIKFGFDINYQLLESEAKCNKSRNTAYTLVDQTAPAPTQNVAEFFCRFPSDDNVVHYLTSSWEEVLDKLQSGKASYYDGQ
ncbi:uncharacterized protein LOC128997777 isoform X4 [Macrosteles quadrilineatus]|uniref:uncharacterized protein LOC128997777 isoform X4 n=1 Tax=Macrosteles quadrilineatus TaxID=74068 RepID=UPI0023E309D5|nr:uncharacterized protein LOC128997777 isoform X4 [Macrosteles quadrilineatus]